MTEQELTDRIKVLEDAIREHRSQKADDRCIEDDDRLYEALGDGIRCDRRVGNQCEMLVNCMRFVTQRTEPGGWLSYAELEKKLALTENLLNEWQSSHRECVDALCKATSVRPGKNQPIDLVRHVIAERNSANVFIDEIIEWLTANGHSGKGFPYHDPCNCWSCRILGELKIYRDGNPHLKQKPLGDQFLDTLLALLEKTAGCLHPGQDAWGYVKKTERAIEEYKKERQ